MGILSHHVPSITQLKPGVVEVIVDGTSGDKWFGIFPIERLAYYVL
jgi:F0F1-type ATP synthase epsilon subunit